MGKTIQQKTNRSFPWQEWLADGYLALLVSVFLLYPGRWGYRAIGYEKTALAYLLLESYVGLAVVLQLNLLLTGSSIREMLEQWKRAVSPVKFLLAFYLLWSLAATVRAGGDAWQGISRREGGKMILLNCLTFFLLSVYARPKGWLLGVFGVSMSLNALVALIQMQGGNPLNLYPGNWTYFDANVAYNGSYLGLTGNADLTSALLAMGVAVFGTALWKLRGNGRFWMTVPFVLCLTALLQCRVAAGYVAMAGAVLLGVPALLQSRKVKILAWVSTIGIVILGVLVLYFWTPGAGTLDELHRILHGQLDDSFGSGRILIWRQILGLLPEHGLLGIGPDLLASLHLKGASWQEPTTGAWIQYEIDIAHNEYLNIAISQGLPALVAYGAALLCTAAGWFRRAAGCPALAICGAALLTNGLQVFFGFNLSATGLLFWAFWALTEQILRGRK